MEKRFIFALIAIFSICSYTYSQNFVHPGCLHKKSDLDRMKYMVEAEIEPYISTYNALKEHPQASYSYVVKGDTTMTEAADGLISADGGAAYLNSLMWYITGDERHALKCVEIFNAWVNVTKTNAFSLRSGTSSWKLIEGAEIIKSTYSGWKEEDIDKFKAMLVYPGYSTTTIPGGNKSFYWNIVNGDPQRHGNQDAIGFRAMISMAVFLDNEIMYDRALNYYKGLPHRTDDIPYAKGPGVSGSVISDNPYFTQYNHSNPGTISDYGFNGVLEHYFWENGQCQESSRDQQHSFFGLGIFEMLAEVAWNQGDDAWNYLDNRLLKAFEFNSKYNISFIQSYPDQPEPWEPTVESGEFIVRTDRSGRWTSKAMNPYFESDFERLSRGDFIGKRPIYEQAMAHFDVRMGFSDEEIKWTSRGRDLGGIELNGWTVDHPGWGGLTFRRPDYCAGDPISGFSNGKPVFDMPVIPTTIEAENFDYFPGEAEGRTYHDSDSLNLTAQYRLNEGVDIDTCSEGGYQLSNLEDGEWLSYTVNVSATSLYNISIRYASANANGKIKFSFGGEDKTEEVIVPFGGEHSNGLTDYKDLIVANDIVLFKGVQSMRISISGDANAFVLNNVSLALGSDHSCDDNLPSIIPSPRKEEGIFYSYYEGAWDSLPDFSTLSPLETGITDSIHLLDGIASDSFALVFEGYIDITILGNYTFYTQSDEGSRLFIDGIEVVENDGLHELTEQSGEICLDEGFHEIRVEYFEKDGNEELNVMFEGPGISKRSLPGLYGVGPCPNIAITPPDSLSPGLMYTYYTGTWNNLPEFDLLSPLNRGVALTISTSPGEASNHFGLTFDGYILIEESGEYTFYTASDDGSRLSIDSMEVVDNDGSHGVVEKSGSLCLEAGYHEIKIEYFEKSGGQSLKAFIEGPGIDKRELTNLFSGPLPPKVDQFITFNPLDTVTDNLDYLDPGAVASSGLTVSYSSSNTDVAIVSDGQIEILSEGTTEITASQDGNGAYNAAEDVDQTLVVTVFVSGLNEEKIQSVVLYPNPVSNKLVIKKHNTGQARIEFFDPLGKLVLVNHLINEETILDISTLSAGIYVVKISADDLFTSQIIVKE